MHIANTIKVALITALLGTSLSACDFFEQDDRTFNAGPQLEFVPLNETVDEGAGEMTVAIQLIGRQRDADLSVSYVVGEETTAEAGVHYTLNSMSATIPAGESSTEITLTVLDNEVDDDGTNYELFLTLQDSGEVIAAENLKTYTLTIRGVDEEDEDPGAAE